MEFSTKQNLEWNMGGVNGDRVKKKEETPALILFAPVSLIVFLFYSITHQDYGPIVHVLFSETAFRGSHWSVL